MPRTLGRTDAQIQLEMPHKHACVYCGYEFICTGKRFQKQGYIYPQGVICANRDDLGMKSCEDCHAHGYQS